MNKENDSKNRTAGRSEALNGPFDLSSYGILKGISETIVCTGFETPNAAPIGIIRKSGKTLVRLFDGSQTKENVSKEGYLTANVVLDPLLLVRSTFSDLAPEEFGYVEIEDHRFPVLKAAAAWVAFECTNVKNKGSVLVAELLPFGAGFCDENRTVIPAPNRGFNAVLEATVHATRYQLTGEVKYADWIRHYEVLVRKCGGQKEKQAMKLLYEVLGFE